MNLNACIASAAYAVPSGMEMVDEILRREHTRVTAALEPLPSLARQKAVDGLGLTSVRVCDADTQPYNLVLQAASQAIADAGIKARDIHLILDFSSFPGENTQSLSFAHRLSAELGAETAVNLSFKAGGCAALHLAIKTALGWMSMDNSIQTAVLVTGDTAPPGNRSLLPITVQGDAASAVILRRNGHGPTLLGVETTSLGHLHQAISLNHINGSVKLIADALSIENKVMPIYYLNLFRLIHKVLAASSLSISDVDHFIYSNISHRDRDGFRRMLSLSEDDLPLTPMADFGHTFASDLVINYVEMQRDGLIHPGQLLLFASVGIGFTWGVTLARAQ
ncbi:MAG TPA: 3-oxoacyl-[acyl-carrier-protein] synthase III C-terminal domain-containing protein [Acidobacteriaceae bacterium]